MTTRLKLTNNAVARLAENVLASTTTAQLEAGGGSKFPTTSDGFPFYVTVANVAGQREIWKVVARSFDQLSIVRAQEGTTALPFYAGDIVELRLTAGALMAELNRLEAKIDAAVIGLATPTYALPTASQLKSQLTGQLTVNELTDALRSRINLLDATDVIAGSVSARIKAETDARVLSIQEEIDARIAAINAEAGNRTTYVQNYAYSKQDVDYSIAYSASVVTSAYTGAIDAAKTAAIGVAAADVRNYSYSKSTIDAAEAAQLSTITTSYTTYADGVKDAAISVANADVRNYAYSKSGVDGAISASEATLRSEFSSSGGATTAYVQSYAYSKSEVDASQAGLNTQITTNYTTYADTKKSEAITAAASDVRTYAYSKSTMDSSFASQSSALTTSYQAYADGKKAEAISASAADVRTYSYSKSEADSAISSSVTQLTTTVNGHTTTLETNGSSINGLKAQYTVKIDNNGYVTGYGLASSLVGAVPTSAFVINADAFQVVGPDAAAAPMFSVGGGTVGFSGELKGPSGTLGVITAMTLRTGTTGARSEIDQNGGRVHSTSGAVRFKFGNLAV